MDLERIAEPYHRAINFVEAAISTTEEQWGFMREELTAIHVDYRTYLNKTFNDHLSDHLSTTITTTATSATNIETVAVDVNNNNHAIDLVDVTSLTTQLSTTSTINISPTLTSPQQLSTAQSAVEHVSSTTNNNANNNTNNASTNTPVLLPSTLTPTTSSISIQLPSTTTTTTPQQQPPSIKPPQAISTTLTNIAIGSIVTCGNYIGNADTWEDLPEEYSRSLIVAKISWFQKKSNSTPFLRLHIILDELLTTITDIGTDMTIPLDCRNLQKEFLIQFAEYLWCLELFLFKMVIPWYFEPEPDDILNILNELIDDSD